MHSVVIQLDRTGEGCNGSSLSHYVLWKFTNTISLHPFLISGGYIYSIDQYGACTYVLHEFEFEFHVLSEIGFVPTNSVQLNTDRS